jgi:hypothetical protein
MLYWVSSHPEVLGMFNESKMIPTELFDWKSNESNRKCNGRQESAERRQETKGNPKMKKGVNDIVTE